MTTPRLGNHLLVTGSFKENEWWWAIGHEGVLIWIASECQTSAPRAELAGFAFWLNQSQEPIGTKSQYLHTYHSSKSVVRSKLGKSNGDLSLVVYDSMQDDDKVYAISVPKSDPAMQEIQLRFRTHMTEMEG